MKIPRTKLFAKFISQMSGICTPMSGICTCTLYMIQYTVIYPETHWDTLRVVWTSWHINLEIYMNGPFSYFA